MDKAALLEWYERMIEKPATQWGPQELEAFYGSIKTREVMMEQQTVYLKARGCGVTSEIIKEHAKESVQQLAETIATMTIGLLRTHGIYPPPTARVILENRAAEFLLDTTGILTQIEAQLLKSMERPLPPAA